MGGLLEGGFDQRGRETIVCLLEDSLTLVRGWGTCQTGSELVHAGEPFFAVCFAGFFDDITIPNIKWSRTSGTHSFRTGEVIFRFGRTAS